MRTAADTLAELLASTEEELEALKWGWAYHSELKEPQTLPVPRLEIWFDEENSDDFNRHWIYRMVYSHYLGHCVAVPLGATKCSGGSERPRPLMDELPLRDVAHIKHDSKAWGWPAFIVRGSETLEIPL